MPALTEHQTASMTKDMYVAALKKYKEAKTVHDSIYYMASDDKGMGNKETDILGVGRFDKHSTENQNYAISNPTEGFTKRCKYEEFSQALNFSRRLVERNVKFDNILKKIAGTYGFAHRCEKEIYAATPFNNGGDLSGNDIFDGTYIGETDSSGDLLYDSIPFFAESGNNHTNKAGDTYYNSDSTLTLTGDNFQAVYVLYTNSNNRNERSQIVDIIPDTLLTDSGDDMFMARRILQATNLPGGDMNDPNVYANLVTPISWSYLTDSAFYVGKRNLEDSMQFINAEDLELNFWRNNDNGAYRVSATFMIGVWIKDWRYWARGGGSAA